MRLDGELAPWLHLDTAQTVVVARRPETIRG